MEAGELTQATLNARPEPLAIDLARTAIVVVDMQNAFVKEGGMFDEAGWPIAGAQAVIEPCRRGRFKPRRLRRAGPHQPCRRRVPRRDDAKGVCRRPR